MMNFFNFNKLNGYELRLQGHKGWVYNVNAHDNGEWIFSAGVDKTVRMFSTSTGKCIKKFKGHRETVWTAVPLDSDTLLSSSDDHTARLWKVSDGSCLRTIHFDENAWWTGKLDDNRFAIGTISGMLHIFEKDENQRFTRLCNFKAHENGVNYVCAWENRFATASLDCTAKIWNLDTFECLGVLSDHTESVRSIFMGESFIVTGSFDGILRVYDAETYRMLRTITTHNDYIRSVNLVGPKEFLLSSSDDKTTRLFNTSSGDLIWTKQFKEAAVSSTVLKDGRIATSLKHGEIVIYRPPEHLIPHMKLLRSYRIIGPKETQVLHDALLSCISGYSSPFDVCKNLIKYETCSVSFEEWCSAHRILILAVEDGDIEKRTQYNGEQSWWFDQLYLAIRDTGQHSDEEYRSIKSCLAEAKQYGLIESIDAVLAALHVTNDLKKTARTLHRAGILIIERILRTEDQLERLKEAYVGYIKSHRKSQLVGLALQVIPIAGGAVAGALSAGSEIVNGLSVKDITDYALGYGSNIAESHIDTLGDRILQKAANSLTIASIDSMDLSRREKLEEASRFCELDLSTLRQLFLERLTKKHSAILQGADHITFDEIDGEEKFGALTDTDDGPYRDINSVDGGQIDVLSRSEETVLDLSEGHGVKESKIVRKLCDGEDSILPGHDQGEPKDAENESPKEYIGNSMVVSNLKPLTKKGIIQLRQAEVTASSVKLLSQESIAGLWAAYTCRFDARNGEEELRLRACLSKSLKMNDIFGPELVDRRLISVTEILSVVLEGLRKDGMEIKLGMQARLKRFLLDLES